MCMPSFLCPRFLMIFKGGMINASLTSSSVRGKGTDTPSPAIRSPLKTIFLYFPLFSFIYFFILDALTYFRVFPPLTTTSVGACMTPYFLVSSWFSSASIVS